MSYWDKALCRCWWQLDFHPGLLNCTPRPQQQWWWCCHLFDLKVTRSDFTELKQELVMLELERRFINILIGCFYRPQSPPTSFWWALDQQLEEVLGVEHPPPTLLLTADLNVDVLDTKHPHYNHLHSFLAAHNLTNHVSSHTRYLFYKKQLPWSVALSGCDPRQLLCIAADNSADRSWARPHHFNSPTNS